MLRTITSHRKSAFGKLRLAWLNFTNCGVRRRQGAKTKDISLDQNEYAALLRLIARPDLAWKIAEDAAIPELHSLYRSLLGAVALLLLTRIDIAVFVSALQRWGHAPNIIRVKRLNVLTT